MFHYLEYLFFTPTDAVAGVCRGGGMGGGPSGCTRLSNRSRFIFLGFAKPQKVYQVARRRTQLPFTPTRSKKRCKITKLQITTITKTKNETEYCIQSYEPYKVTLRSAWVNQPGHTGHSTLHGDNAPRPDSSRAH